VRSKKTEILHFVQNDKERKIAFLSQMQNDSIPNLKNFSKHSYFKVLKI